jgi:uncharacterized protein
MGSYWEIFTSRAFLAVILAFSKEQAHRNARTAFDNGADGIFLMNRSIKPNELVRVYKYVRDRLREKKYPRGWIGLNMLGLDAYAAFLRLPEDANGMWVDDSGVTDTSVSISTEEFVKGRAKRPSWHGLYFGGVAFSDESDLKDPGAAARMAKPYMDVVVTSGANVGSAPDPGKIHEMKRALDDFPLAVAGGITDENVHLYLDWADCLIVGSGIRASVAELDPKLVRRLADKIHV